MWIINLSYICESKIKNYFLRYQLLMFHRREMYCTFLNTPVKLFLDTSLSVKVFIWCKKYVAYSKFDIPFRKLKWRSCAAPMSFVNYFLTMHAFLIHRKPFHTFYFHFFHFRGSIMITNKCQIQMIYNDSCGNLH